MSPFLFFTFPLFCGVGELIVKTRCPGGNDNILIKFSH